MTRTQKRLVEQHLKLAYAAAARYAMRHDADDLRAVACLALCEAAVKYNRRKAQFPTFARVLIQRELIKHVANDLPVRVGKTETRADIAFGRRDPIITVPFDDALHGSQA